MFDLGFFLKDKKFKVIPKVFFAGIVFIGVLNVIGASVILAGEDKVKSSENSSKENKGLRVDDLPKPIPDIMDSLKRVGNEVGNGISKAAGEGAKAINKTMSNGATQSKDK